MSSPAVLQQIKANLPDPRHGEQLADYVMRLRKQLDDVMKMANSYHKWIAQPARLGRRVMIDKKVSWLYWSKIASERRSLDAIADDEKKAKSFIRNGVLMAETLLRDGLEIRF
jgi:hypothetical protein